MPPTTRAGGKRGNKGEEGKEEKTPPYRSEAMGIHPVYKDPLSPSLQLQGLHSHRSDHLEVQDKAIVPSFMCTHPAQVYSQALCTTDVLQPVGQECHQSSFCLDERESPLDACPTPLQLSSRNFLDGEASTLFTPHQPTVDSQGNSVLPQQDTQTVNCNSSDECDIFSNDYDVSNVGNKGKLYCRYYQRGKCRYSKSSHSTILHNKKVVVHHCCANCLKLKGNILDHTPKHPSCPTAGQR